MPRVDEFILRDSLGRPNWRTKPSGPVKILLNGWFMGRESWPPAAALSPLFLSFHIAQQPYKEYDYRIPSSWLLADQSIEYLKAHEPIGCRDLHTVRLLRAAGVNCFFSGCLTLTLRRPNLPRGTEILFVDVNAALHPLCDSVPSDLRRFISILTPLTEPGGSIRGRLLRANSLLERFAQAHLVITSRLHCLLPCLAFNTPVLFIPPAESLERLEGYEGLYHSLHVEHGKVVSPIDWEVPLENPLAHLPLATALRRRVNEYVNPS